MPDVLLQDQLEIVDIELNVLILAAIACIYSLGPSSPQRGFASKDAIQKIPWKGDSYSVRAEKMDDVRGVMITKSINAVHGNRGQERWWFPFEAFDSVALKLQGKKLCGQTG